MMSTVTIVPKYNNRKTKRNCNGGVVASVKINKDFDKSIEKHFCEVLARVSTVMEKKKLLVYLN